MNPTRTRANDGVARLRFMHRLDLALMRGEQMRSDLSHKYVDRVVQENTFAACQDPAQFEAKLLEAMVYLTSETGLHDVRTYSMPKERIHIQLTGADSQALPGIPAALRKIAALAVRENRAFLMRSTGDSQVYFTGNTPQDNQAVYQARTETFGLAPVDTGSTLCHGLLILPLVKGSGEVVGVVAVAGPRADFIRPHVDLAAIRKLGLHASEIFAVQ